MALRDYQCLDCGYVVESLIRSELDIPTHCPLCAGTKMEQQISAIGGYQGNTGSASTKPRCAGSFKRPK